MQIDKQKSLLAFFMLYLLALVWIIVFKLQLSFDLLPQENSLNLIPFYDPNIERLSIYLGEKIYNMILFIPFGLYIALLKKDWSLIQKIKPVFLTSLTFEIIQLISGVGSADITDIIQNTLGGVLGIGVFQVAKKIFRSHDHKVASILAIGLTVLMLIAISLIKVFIKIKLN